MGVESSIEGIEDIGAVGNLIPSIFMLQQVLSSILNRFFHNLQSHHCTFDPDNEQAFQSLVFDAVQLASNPTEGYICNEEKSCN